MDENSEALAAAAAQGAEAHDAGKTVDDAPFSVETEPHPFKAWVTGFVGRLRERAAADIAAAEASVKSKDDKPKLPASAARAGRAGDDNPIYRTAADIAFVDQVKTVPTPGLSATPGLVKVQDSKVPGLGNGAMVDHVMGPQQSPVDPIAAGLDLKHDPKTRNELAAPTLTGTTGAGPRPSTYAEKPDGQLVQQSTEETGETIAPRADNESGNQMENAGTAIDPGA